MEENVWWVWKFILQALGCSMFLLPYAAGQVGLPVFSFILLVEAFVTGNSMVIFRSMAHSRNEMLKAKRSCTKEQEDVSDEKDSEAANQSGQDEGGEDAGNTNADKADPSKNADTEEYMTRTNYFTIVSDFLDGEDSFFWYNIICIVFFLEVVICSSFYFKLFEDIALDAGWIPNLTPAERPGYRLLIHIMIALFLIAMEEAKSPEICTSKRNMIDMPAVVERLHGYSWKRCCLFFLLLFFVVTTIQLNAAVPIDQVDGNESAMCNAGLTSTDETLLSGRKWQDISVCTSVVMFSFMHFAIFLPICLEELKLDETKYARNVKVSSLVFIAIFFFVAYFGTYILGNSAPVIFPSAFGSDIYGFNINVIASLFTLVAMLLRVMASDSAYWIIVSLLFVVSYYVSHWTPSVLYLAILLGGGTSNLLLIIFPRFAYLKAFKTKNKAYYTTLACVLLHTMLFLMSVLTLFQ